MNEREALAIKKMRPDLLERMRVTAVFLAQLVSDDVITEDDEDKIENETDQTKQVKCVLAKLSDHSDGFRALLRALRRNKQGDLARGLEDWANRGGSTSTDDRPSSGRRTDSESGSARLVCIGGRNDDDDALSSAECYLIDEGRWSDVGDMPCPRNSFGAVVCNGELYVIAGRDDDNDDLASGDVLRNGKWTKISPMSTARAGAAVAELDGSIYAIAGHIMGNALNSAERYDPVKNEWTPIASLSAPMYNCVAIASKGKLYLSGGSPDTPTALNSCVRYDPGADRWTSAPSMKDERWGHGTAVVDEAVYVAGGDQPNTQLNSAERLDDRENKWTVLPSMNVPRSGVGMTSYARNAYVAGGFRRRNILNALEEFDTRANSWTQLGNMSTRRNWTQLISWTGELNWDPTVASRKSGGGGSRGKDVRVNCPTS